MQKHPRIHNAVAALAHGVLAGVALLNREPIKALPELLLAAMYLRLVFLKE